MKRVGYFPFKELRKSGQAYFISDMELFDFFQANEQSLKDYDIDYYPDWSFQAKEQLVQVFLDGYQGGKVYFRENIGISYGTLPHVQKLEYLHNFCLFCLDFLYFDGELDDTLFYKSGLYSSEFVSRIYWNQ